MEKLSYVKPEKIWLKGDPTLNERWVQDRIAEDPSILGLGDLVLKDKERIHPKAGRLDLLFQEIESNRRYETEIQLGRTDESHLIRTIEYWDIERKRYPQYDHCAVIVAEDITSRFLNVIGLFNGSIPLIAIQMNAVRVGDAISLLFTTVLNELTLGLVDEDEDQEVTDRSYWEKRNKATLRIADDLLKMVKAFDPQFELRYNKSYVGLAKDGSTYNFSKFYPQTNVLRFEPRLSRSEEIETKLKEAGLDLMDYYQSSNRYRIRLSKSDIKKHTGLLEELLKDSYDNYFSG